MAHLEGNHTKRCRMPLLVELRTRGQVEDKSLISCASRYILEYASPPTADLDSPLKRKLLKRAAIRISLRVNWEILTFSPLRLGLNELSS